MLPAKVYIREVTDRDDSWLETQSETDCLEINEIYSVYELTDETVTAKVKVIKKKA